MGSPYFFSISYGPNYYKTSRIVFAQKCVKIAIRIILLKQFLEISFGFCFMFYVSLINYEKTIIYEFP